MEPATLVREILCVVAVATNEYQTSSSSVPPQPLTWLDADAQEMLPAVVTQLALEVKGVAFVHSSFEGTVMVELTSTLDELADDPLAVQVITQR